MTFLLPRPVALSDVQAKFLADPKQKGLRWHVTKPNEPNLMYPVKSLQLFGSVTERAMLALYFPDGSEDAGQARLDIISNQSIQLAIPLSDVLDAKQSILEDSKLTAVNFTYKPEKSSKWPKQFTFWSQRDASDVSFAVKTYKLGRFKGFNYGQICIHKGPLDESTEQGWKQGYARLVPNRLILFQDERSTLPREVIALSNGPEMAEVFSKSGESEFLLTIKQKSQPWKFKAADPAESELWTRAITAQQGLKQIIADLLVMSAPVAPTPLLRPGASTDNGMMRSASGSVTPLSPRSSGGSHGSTGSVSSASASESINTASNPSTPSNTTARLRPQPLGQWNSHSANSSPAISEPNSPVGNSESRSISSSPSSRGRSLSADVTNHNSPSHGMTGLPPLAPPTKSLIHPEIKVSSPVHKGVFNPEHKLKTVQDIREVAHSNSFLGLCRHMQGKHSVLGHTGLTPVEQWLKTTKGGRSRKDVLKACDDALTEAHTVFTKTQTFLNRTRLVLTDEDHGSAASQMIGFAFPGFNSHVFDVGRMSVLSPSLLLFVANGLGIADWDGALRSKSPGKEIMNWAPDATALMEEGKMQAARQAMLEGQVNVLHNLALAAYLKLHISRSAGKQGFTLGAGDVVWWNSVAEGLGDDNKNHFAQMSNIAYVFNPPEAKITEFIKRDEAAIKAAHSRTGSVTGGLTETRFLFDSINLLAFVRDVAEMRYHSLIALSSALQKWKSERKDKPKDKTDPVKVERTASMKTLTDAVAKETAELADLMSFLPESVYEARKTVHIELGEHKEKKLLSTSSSGGSGASLNSIPQTRGTSQSLSLSTPTNSTATGSRPPSRQA